MEESLVRGAGAGGAAQKSGARGMNLWIWFLVTGVTALWAAMLAAVAYVVARR